MSSGKTKLLTPNTMATLSFVFLLAIRLPSAYAGSVSHAITAHGNAQIDTAQSKFGGASGLFDGAGDYLSSADSGDWAFGGGDFTIDFWVRFNALPTASSGMTICGQYANTNNRWYTSTWNIGGEYRWYFIQYTGGVSNINFYRVSAISANTWYHIAYVRSGNSWYIFRDGTQLGGVETKTDAIADIAGTLTIGEHAYGSYLNGWMDEFRISKGIARWTGSFSPPSTAHTADSYTVLLLHMNGADGSTTFVDDSVVTELDFSINASPLSQTVGAGSTASFTLNLDASGGFSGTVSLSVTSGSPPGVTPTITPNSISTFPGTATLSVPTLITTSGTFNIVVTATSGVISHTATVVLTVTGAASYSFNVRAGATQVIATLTYTWSGSGSPPSGSITLVGPGGSPILQESGAVVYDRTSIAVSGSTNTYSIIHRVTFTITAPSQAQWTALVSLSGVSNYNVAIEVS